MGKFAIRIDPSQRLITRKNLTCREHPLRSADPTITNTRQKHDTKSKKASKNLVLVYTNMYRSTCLYKYV
jgi:hypothetical protein